MKYQVAGAGWPLGARLIEAGTIIDTSTIEWASLAWVPMDAIALDQVTYDCMTDPLGVSGFESASGTGCCIEGSAAGR
jgi:hypothetical protein